ncbi:hypothetical protein FT643_02090 [Ketobacter sp. MCCC 1A13808]|uniref:type II secretion system protein GspD n=1 Tax=Ketobacter sp. MCCC 1A13808 TaxID=2602738 RepID=UPI000F13AE30|nr:hypothetical protein [Ketobacter sp. MCCC 1A13808]MVF10922.1 hypothetical protein [Ketobacter sp. MCCC 1A13808]RLP56314.1 MAG: hypothetical protein D6160_02685 [Ketobacter sp.]
MKIQLNSLTAILLSSALVSSCAVTPFDDDEKYKPLQTKPTKLVVERSDTYLREVTPEEAVFNRKVSFSGRVALIDAIRKHLVDVNIVPGDANVQLNQEVLVFAQDMLMKDYLQYLESVTGYDIEYRNNVVTVRSFVQREWNVAAFASNRSVKLKVGSTFNTQNTTVSEGGETTTSGGNDNKIESNYSDDEWSILVDGAKDILNVSKSAAKTAGSAETMKSYVQAVRSVGTINVGGNAKRVDALDQFISNLIINGQRQVNINVQAYEVSLNDDRGAGIDWQQLATVNGSLNGNPFNFDFSSIDGGSRNVVNNANGIFQNNVNYESSSIKADMMLRFLSTYGEVELLNQPNVTVRNGSYAYISTGEELTFIGEIETEEGNNNNDRTTAKLNSVRVGVTLAVTPRILNDGRIMLEIWPVISSISGEEEYTFEGLKFSVPSIALNELSTEVITESGKPIQLGGFIRRSIEKNLQDLPWKDKMTQSFVNPIFKSEDNELSRRELVLTVTPTIVEGV